ncbi:putative hydro-lyase [Pseudonocardia sp. KRD-184]|uniref:Putative hydro-lyase I4I82_15025 n=1 Tax=Pseudonocardia oceani TaxID=2792013 RepID=A0ABS6UAN4_9PSEU|nr:putative hydro-lyase [Pseudonocardia oceani]MBW0091652.1 putative hydro-lyase [Pseudonocardia oceani]MBW0094749.1 putative hydro-lyase [Pseudonocardia oceani]MBW0111288.1 putative hydro-lyase [Pseudonocardia oceani]MBW0120257.1 putative hydro-lyase [Pseudonocardia oceani]MBW0128981.1 putative hydro-lyase [Pseudonocardia oceani]
MNPADARARFRNGLVTPTAGWCDGYAQANLISVPRERAWDFLLFAQRNPKPCPVLDVLDAGAVAGPILDGDVRTDVPLYRVHVDGEQVAEPTDVREWWRKDLVSFLIGCSFTFERALGAAGVPVRHVEQGVNVPMYRTSWRCRPAGDVSGPLVVSMRYVPQALVETAVATTARYPAVHGAPVHVGDPRELGVGDLDAPDHGDAVAPEPGDVPVFWACGVTPQAAVVESRPPLAIAHAPGHMLVTDARDEDYLI